MYEEEKILAHNIMHFFGHQARLTKYRGSSCPKEYEKAKKGYEHFRNILRDEYGFEFEACDWSKQSNGDYLSCIFETIKKDGKTPPLPTAASLRGVVESLGG